MNLPKSASKKDVALRAALELFTILGKALESNPKFPEVGEAVKCTKTLVALALPNKYRLTREEIANLRGDK